MLALRRFATPYAPPRVGAPAAADVVNALAALGINVNPAALAAAVPAAGQPYAHTAQQNPIIAYAQAMGVDPRDLGDALSMVRQATARSPEGLNQQRMRQKYKRRLILPLNKDAVAAGAPVVVSVAPKCLYELQQWNVSNAIAAFFEVSSIMAGMQPIFAGGGNVSCLDFVANSLADTMIAGEVEGGVPIDVTILNISGAPQDFKSKFIGDGTY